MLLTFLYHQIKDPSLFFVKHLEYLKDHYSIVLPQDPISKKITLCLTFDDATFDFYHHVFPILKKLKIKALLAVPVSFIVKETNLSPSIRLSVSSEDLFKDDIYKKKVPFCTWKELKEMVDSSLIEIASHSLTHPNLVNNPVDLTLEIIESKRILENNLNVPVKTFVYPYGKFNHSIRAFVQKHYSFQMRIGSSLNFSWNNFNGMTYRICCDHLQHEKEPMIYSRFFSYFWFYLLNTVRGR